MKRTKVFGIGFHKTGTKTLGACLTRLGYDHHSLDQAAFRDYLEGDLDGVVKRVAAHDSFEDWPWPLLYRELDEQFPGSRFILTTRRDENAWFESLSAHVKRLPAGGFSYRKYIYGFDNPDKDPVHHIATYLAHNRSVREYFSERPQQLLELCWERGDGWPVLCEFLGYSIPDEPFPHKNRARPR